MPAAVIGMKVIARSVSLAEGSMAISAVVLLGGYLLSVPLSLLIGYMVIATTFVLVGLQTSVENTGATSKHVLRP